MSHHEFDIIEDYFKKHKPKRPEVSLAIGDDAAVMSVDSDHELVITTDTLVCGVHFFEDEEPENVGYQSLAVSLSDLAAMGAEPVSALLALTLPDANETWLTGFSKGFFDCANAYQVQLMGGDTTRGPLTITVQLLGKVPRGKAMKRKGAKPGHKIYVTDQLGEAALVLKAVEDSIPYPVSLYPSLARTQPRVYEGIGLRAVASACIDVSDGLLADLGHILSQSAVGATVYANQIPLPSLTLGLHERELLELALTGGGDYELCFTVSPKNEPELKKIFELSPAQYTCIGEIERGAGLRVFDSMGHEMTFDKMGYQHF